MCFIFLSFFPYLFILFNEFHVITLFVWPEPCMLMAEREPGLRHWTTTPHTIDLKQSNLINCYYIWQPMPPS